MTLTRASALLLLAAPFLPAQRRLSIQDLVKFVQSSIQLKHPDRQVAQFLKQIKLDYQLEERIIEDLQGLGAGPQTLARLKELRAESLNLPLPPAEVKQAAAAPLAGPTSVEREKILAMVAEQAREYTRSLPDFICVQVTRRYFDPTGAESWNLADTITTRLSFVEGREEYKVVSINNRPVIGKSIEDIGGSTSTGEFGTMLKEIFDPYTQTRFEWERWGTLRGRRMHVFRYRVRQDRSKYSIVWDRREQIIAGYSGLLYTDRETNSIMRIVMDAENIPASFPVQETKTILDYDYQPIAEKEFLVPLRAEVRSRSGRLITRNIVEFRLYQKFGVETEILVDETLVPLSEDKFKEQPTKP
jgi:hypothetical protein